MKIKFCLYTKAIIISFSFILIGSKSQKSMAIWKALLCCSRVKIGGVHKKEYLDRREVTII